MRLLPLVALLFALTGNALAQQWVDNATISPTSTLQTNRLCYTDGRDLACDGAAGLITTSGTLQLTKVSATNISVTSLTVNGQSITSGGGVSYLVSLTDVSASGASSGMLLRHNGTKWESVGASTALSTTSMYSNWPDAIMCYGSSGSVTLYHSYYQNDTLHEYVSGFTHTSGSDNLRVRFTPAGVWTLNANTGLWPGFYETNCNSSSTTISSMYAAGRAFNFIGSNLSSAASPNNSIQWSNNGTQAGDTNLQWVSNTAVVSVTGTVSATNHYGLSVSSTTGTFGSIGAGNIAFTGYVSGTNISATFIQAGTGGTCAAGTAGGIRYNSTSNTLQICTGATGWQSMPSSSVASGGTLASLSDVSASSPASGMLLRHNGTKWESVGASTALSTTTMVQSWPDAIICNGGGASLTLLLTAYSATNYYYRYNPGNGTDYSVIFNSSGAYSSNSNFGAYDCVTNAWSISQLYAQGRAFNFIGSNLSSAASPDQSIQWSNNGNQTGDANMVFISSTNTLSMTGVISATNISVTMLQPGPGSTCGTGTVGAIRRNPSTGRLQICLDH